MGDNEQGGDGNQPRIEVGWSLKEAEYVLYLISVNSCLHRVRSLPRFKLY